MNLNRLTLLAAALSLAVCATASAGSKTQTALVQPTSFQCSWAEGSAESSWDDSNTNAGYPGERTNPLGAKYGGDLETTVNYGWICDNGDPGPSEDDTTGSAVIAVETDLSSDQTATYHYSCSGDAPNGACLGIVDGETWWNSVLAALSATKSVNCPVGSYATTTSGKGEGFSVKGGVKSMIPGKGNGQQNYTQTVMEPCGFQD